MTNYLNESLTLDLFHPEKSGLLITDISGIGAPDVTVNLTDYATADGGLFTGARAKSRQIIIKVAPVDSELRESVETCRQKTYRYFPIKHPLTLTFETDNRLVSIEGYVSRNDPTIFSREEEIQIDIQCPDPYFYLAGGMDSVVFSGIQPMFEFPFSNEKVEDDTETVHHIEYDDFGRKIREWDEEVPIPFSRNLIVMSELKETNYGIVDYRGEVDVGIVVTMQARGAVKNPMFYKQGTTNYMLILTDKIAQVAGSSFGKGDEIVISTVPGKRYVRLYHGGKYTNIINALDRESVWVDLNPGANTFSYTAEEGADLLNFKIDYRTAYQGV